MPCALSPPNISGWLVCEKFELWEKPEQCQQAPGTRGDRGRWWERTGQVAAARRLPLSWPQTPRVTLN